MLEGDFFEYYPELADNSSTNNYNGSQNNNLNSTNQTLTLEDNMYFSLSYPEEYSKLKDVYPDGLAKIYLSPPSDEFIIEIRYEDGHTATSQDFLNDSLNAFEGHQIEIIESYREITIDGIAGYEIIIHDTSKTSNDYSIDAFAIDNGKLISYLVILNGDTYSASKTQIDKIISSIKVKWK